MPRGTLLFCLLLLAPIKLTLAETVYVTDRLHLSLHELPDSGSGKIKTLISGETLTVLERTKNYAKIKTAEGEIGWAKSVYLVTEIPPRYRLTQLETQNESLIKKLVATKKGLKLTQKKLLEATQDQQTMEELRNQNTELLTEQQRYMYSVPLIWFASVTVIVLVLGFLAGLWWLDYKSRKRHGGYRIY